MPTEIKQANMLKEIISNRKLIWDLSKNDFKTRFAGSYLGIIWAFVQPIVTVLVYWFVFEKGMHASGINLRSGITAPFVLWLIAGLYRGFSFKRCSVGEQMR
jgi:teichoic acid transport system permease protein